MSRPVSDLRRRITGESARFVVTCADCRDDDGWEKQWAQTCTECAAALIRKHREQFPLHNIRLLGERKP